jgi:hypothetical protein
MIVLLVAGMTSFLTRGLEICIYSLVPQIEPIITRWFRTREIREFVVQTMFSRLVTVLLIQRVVPYVKCGKIKPQHKKGAEPVWTYSVG